MHSNISLKGDGSDFTELRFLIKSDSIMTKTDCQKDAILISGIGESASDRISNVGIEDLKIVRIRQGLSAKEVKFFVGDHCTIGNITSYWGNNIGIRFGDNCWVTGVESENTFRNHVTLDYSHNITISGVYFHDANDHGGDGYGYGVGIWDSSKNRVENSIFKHLRHGVTIIDRSWFNVIGYNYFREQYSYAELPDIIPNFIIPFPDEIEQKWSDIAIHGASFNTWQSEDNPSVPIDPLKTPYYNLIEGNNLEYLCVDATHQKNGTHNTFINNRVTEQIHVMGYDGFPDWLTGYLVFENIALPSILAILGGVAGGQVGFDPIMGAMTGWDLGLWVAYYYSEIFLKFCCKDCAALRMADQFSYVNPFGHDTFRFQNQPKQIFINNYARECNWWRSQILDYPVRMHSEINSSQKNTRKHYATWWGGTQKKTTDKAPALNDLQSCYMFESSPDFWPNMITWPYQYKDDQNPAQQRWHLSGKKTVGVEDSTEYLTIQTISADTFINEDYSVKSGELLKIMPGVTISVKNGKKIVVNGTLIAEGTETDPITFTSSDPDKYWRGIEVKQKDNKPLPSITLSNCIISRANKRALLLESYSEAHIDSCSFINNQDHGAISSEDGSLYLSNSLFMDNTIFSNSQKNGTALYLKNTDAQISNTIFTDNVSNRNATGTVHVKHKDGDESRKTEFFNCYFSNNIFGTNTANENIGLAIHSENYEGVLGIYNCSFIDQAQEIFSSLKNDVIITNSLFWNSACDPHFIKSNQTNPLFSFMISKSFIPDYTQSPNINHYTVLDTVYVGNAMLQLDTETNLYSHGVFSPLVNSASNDIQWLESYVATDLLGNPRYCGSGIDIGAIELMKPEVSVVDSLLDFGDVSVFKERILMCRVENTGTEDLVLDYPLFPEGYSTTIGFPCTIPTAYSGSTAPIDIDDDEDEDDDEEALYTNPFVYIPIKFSPLYHTLDYADKCITFATNDSLCQLIEICVTGKGVAAELSMSADFIHMSDFPANNTPSFGREFLVFKNTGNIGLIIDSLYVQHSDNGFATFQYTTTTQGGGIYIKHNTGRFENNTIADNEAISFGGAIVCDSLGMEMVKIW